MAIFFIALPCDVDEWSFYEDSYKNQLSLKNQILCGIIAKLGSIIKIV